MLPFKILSQAGNLRGKKVLLRLDLNEPVEKGVIESDFRIRKSVPTIEFLKKAGAKIIIISHDGGKSSSLKQIALYLNKLTKVGFVPSISGRAVSGAISRLAQGNAVVLENLRENPGEEKNSPKFARYLASLADIYVNEAFSASHRNHASIVGVPKYLLSYAGFLFEEEYKNLSRALKPKKPFIFILGGAKFETKLPLVKHYLPLAEKIFVGGGLVNSLFKLKGYEMGRSVIGKSMPGLKSILENKKVLLPEDVMLENKKIISPKDLTKDEKIVDIGPKSAGDLSKILKGAKSILFNGPVGIYNEGFSRGTEEILKMMSRTKAETVVGGGDTLSLVSKMKMEKKFSFVSTGGGAMLQFLAEGTLPGIEALKKAKK